MVCAMHTTTQLLSTAEAADFAGKHRSTITRWVQSGRLEPAHRTPGGTLLFTSADLIAALEAEDAS